MTEKPEPFDVPQEFLIRLLQYQDGTITPEQMRILEAQMLDDSRKRDAFYEMQIRGQVIFELYRRAESQTDQLIQNGFKSHPAQPALSSRWSVRPWLAVAATVLLTVGVLIAVWPAPPDIAKVTYINNACWESGQIPEVGQMLKRGGFALKSGRMRLRMPDETVVILAGPSRFELIDDNTLKLEQGKISAKVNNPGSLFTVRTAMMDVIDLGTSFGVKVAKDGQSSVSVFEGAVAVKQPIPKSGDKAILLKKGSSARIRPGQKELETVPYDHAEYHELWPLTNGVDELSEKVEFVPPAAPQPFELFRSDEKLFLMPERQNLILEKPLPVDINKPGRCERYTPQHRPLVAAGKKVNSYLLFFNQEGPKNWKNYRKLTGQITFSKPILGVIGHYQKLKDTDAVVGIEGFDYPVFMQREKDRGLDNRNAGAEEQMAHDVITISPDRKTLSFEISSGPWIDQFRVIVQAN